MISVTIVCFLVTAGFLGFITFKSEVASAATIYVGSGPGNQTDSIQLAIRDFANPGDTVFVYSGVYDESFSINKSINLIGEDKQTTIIDGHGGNPVVMILSTDWVNVTGFTIKNGTRGIWVASSSFINIRDNEIYGNVGGIHSHNSSNNAYINNSVHDQIKKGGLGGHGIFFHGCPYTNNKIIGNVVYNNEADGIHLEDETGGDPFTFWNNSIINNTVYNNRVDGIFIGQGTNNFIIGNIVHHNGLGTINPWGGIHLALGHNNSIEGNILHNNEHGILWGGGAWPSRDNTITRNMIYNNEYGIRMWDAANNTFLENLIFNNNYSVGMDRDSWDNKFINCTLSNPTYDDFNLTEHSYATCLNTTFNKTRVYYGDNLSSGDHHSTLTVMWYMHVKVIYWNGSPVNNAQVWVNNTFGTNIVNGQADSQGMTRWIVVTEYLEQDIDGDHIGDRFYFTPHYVTATDGNLWGYANPNMDISKVVLIILGTPPPLLPPTNLTTKVVNNGDNVELEWDPSTSLALDHYLIYRADSATEFDFTTPYNSSITWPDPRNNTWVDPDTSVTAVDDDFYYIVRAANFDESDISSTSNTAGVWTRTFESGISTFSLPLEPFVKKDTEFYCQDMNASYIKWMNHTTHTWMRHDEGDSANNTVVKVGEGYEIGFLGKSIQTKYTFTGMPGAMISYDDSGFLGFNHATEAKNITVTVEPNGNVTLTWEEPASMNPGDWYKVYHSNTRDGFFGNLGVHYNLSCPAVNFGTNTTTIAGLGANNPGARLYFMVVPFNGSGIRGASTYSIGVWTEEYLNQYDTFGIPLKLDNYQTADWYCDNIPNTVGINYFIYSEQRWGWHSTRMPEGAYDLRLEMTVGYQISTSSATKFIFVGR